jgi:hypothetical protein
VLKCRLRNAARGVGVTDAVKWRGWCLVYSLPRFSCSLSLTLTLSFTHTHFHSHSHSLSLTLTLTFTHTHTHATCLIFSPFPAPTLSSDFYFSTLTLSRLCGGVVVKPLKLEIGLGVKYERRGLYSPGLSKKNREVLCAVFVVSCYGGDCGLRCCRSVGFTLV